MERYVMTLFLIAEFIHVNGCSNPEFPYYQNIKDREIIVPISSQQIHQGLLQKSARNQNVINIGYLLSIVELCKVTKNYICYRRWLKHLSYQEFMISFAYLLAIEEQIASTQDLLHKISHGTFPEQISAKIHLARSTLITSYENIMNDCLQSYFKANFNESGQLVWFEHDNIDVHYKKFYKNVPQNFRDLARKAKKKLQPFSYSDASNIADKSNNSYNQTLLDMVYAGIQQNFPLLKKLCRQYYDVLIDKLYQYYIDQKINRYFERDCDSVSAVDDYKNHYLASGCYEELVLQEWYQEELFLWLCPMDLQNSTTKKLFLGIMPDELILELPMKLDFRFILLRSFLDKIFADGDQQLFKKLFLPCGIFEKYKNHVFVKNQLDKYCFKDAFFCKAINFALAIAEKEQDAITQEMANNLLGYALIACEAKSDDIFISYKNKVVVLYQSLSYKRYDLNILEI